MKNGNLKSMSVDELWELHELVVAKLTDKMAEERARLEERLRKLGSTITRPQFNSCSASLPEGASQISQSGKS